MTAEFRNGLLDSAARRIEQARETDPAARLGLLVLAQRDLAAAIEEAVLTVPVKMEGK